MVSVLTLIVLLRYSPVIRQAIGENDTRVFPPELDKRYPVVVRGDGAWVEDATGKRYLDAMSGGSMAATLGFGRSDLLAAAREQALRLSYVHNEAVTNSAQERLARELVDLAPEGFARVHFVTGGAEAGKALVDLADVVSFTGSVGVGHQVGAAARIWSR